MRRIRKGAQPPELIAWRRSLRPRGLIPPWDQLPNPPSAAMRGLLSQEQRQLCCYCTGSILKGNFHIEHFRPRDGNVGLTYTWKNLFASCQGGGGDLVNARRHCGEAKDNWFVAGTTVDPSQTGVEPLFRFPLTGKVYPAKHLSGDRYAAVDLTITHLNLNAPSLVFRREAMLAQAGKDAGAMDRPSWRRRYLDEHGGQLQEFWPALNYNYGLLWSAILANPAAII